MTADKKETVNVKGERKTVDVTVIDGKPIIVMGSFPRMAVVKDEICDNGVQDPEAIINELKKRRKADIFTFDQKIPDTEPKFNYYYEWDNFAVLEITSFDHWWNKQIGNDARRMVRKAEKQGVVVKVVPFTDELVAGIKSIYDETPIRQGKPFWYYKKEFNKIRDDNSSFLERSEFIGAYFRDELIGFEKIIYTGNRADPIWLLARVRDRDKAPTNALVSKSVEVCAKRGITYLTYGNYLYGKKREDSLAVFKKRNGFEKMDVPRYYAPITVTGAISLKMGLHKNLIQRLPSLFVDIVLRMRTKLYEQKWKDK